MLLCHQYLQLVYQGSRTNHTQNNVAQTYGEILYLSVDKLLAELAFTENDIFLDLGSGLGKIVLQCFLQTPVRESSGIEYFPQLHEQATTALQRVQRELPEFFHNNRSVKLLLGDFFEIPWTAATVVLTGSPCFSARFLKKLAQCLDTQPTLRSVVSLRPLPLTGFTLQKALRVECSWDTSLCYLYQRS
jgi:hypothetical protein